MTFNHMNKLRTACARNRCSIGEYKYKVGAPSCTTCKQSPFSDTFMADPSLTSSSHENSAFTSSSNDNTSSHKQLIKKKALSIAVQYRSASRQWPSKKWLKLKNVHKDLEVVRRVLTSTSVIAALLYQFLLARFS